MTNTKFCPNCGKVDCCNGLFDESEQLISFRCYACGDSFIVIRTGHNKAWQLQKHRH